MKRLLLLLVALLLGLVGLWWSYQGGQGGAFVSGTLEGQEYRLRVPLALQVLRVAVEEGQQVRPGDTLLVLDTLALHAQWKALQAQLQALKHQEQAAQIQIQQIQRDLDRLRRLQGQAVPVQKWEALQANLRAQKQQVQALRAQQQALRQQITALREQVNQAVVQAPAQAWVEEIAVHPGETPVPGQTLVTLVKTDTLEFHTALPQTLLPRVHVGDTVAIQMDALPGESFAGVVVWISQEPEFTPRTLQTSEDRARLVYPARIRLIPSDRRLRPGMTGILQLTQP